MAFGRSVAMLIELRLSRASGTTLQAQIADQLRQHIVGGRLQPGYELPPSRELARQYGISRNTIIHAYEHLISEGYLATVKGVRTVVAESIPEKCLRVQKEDAAPQGNERSFPRAPIVFDGENLAVPAATSRTLQSIDFWPGRANVAHFPAATWRKLADDVLSAQSRELIEYGDPAGLPALREAIARHVAHSRGVRCSADAVIITAGTQEAINLVARMFVAENTGVVIEDPGYGSAAHTFKSYGAHLHAIPVDRDGLVTDLLPQEGISFAYVTPSHQFPTGATLSAPRRRALLDWAHRTGAYILEDDYDCDYSFDGPPALSLAGADNGQCVIYVGTFSKSLGAGVRTGYLIVPPQLIDVARRVKAMNNYGHPWLEQAVLQGFISTGAYQRHLRVIRKASSDTIGFLISRLQASFGQLDIWGVNGGMHVMWLLPDWMPPAEDFKARLEADGVHVHTLASGGAYCQTGLYRDRAILLGYAALTQRQIGRAVEIMQRVTPSGYASLRHA
jgi:GntR family transcriptional regulator / MocR family aminotransferase